MLSQVVLRVKIPPKQGSKSRGRHEFQKAGKGEPPKAWTTNRDWERKESYEHGVSEYRQASAHEKNWNRTGFTNVLVQKKLVHNNQTNENNESRLDLYLYTVFVFSDTKY